MKRTFPLALALSICALPLPGASSPSDVADARVDAICDELVKLSTEGRRQVTLSGLYEASFELQQFYDPNVWQCEYDVDPAIWLEFSPGSHNDPQFAKLLERDHRAYVVLRGQLEGPPPLGADDLRLPVMAALAERTAGRRYGHHGLYYAQLVVEEVLSFSPVPAGVPARGPSQPSPATSPVPTLLAAEVPRYPQAALWAGLSGTVVVEVTIAAGTAVATSVLSGDRLLVDSVLANIATWRFPSEAEVTFTTTFAYELALRRAEEDKNIRYELQLPLHARIIGPARGR